LRAAGRIAGVALLIALLLGLGACASSMALHKKFCPNAGTPNDHCAVMAFAAGAEAALLPQALVVVLIALVTAAVCWREISFVSASVFRLSPSRAPPSR
jgi:hypothetical protein